MGTTYDWTADPLVHLKGPAAADQLKADQALAERLGLKTPAAGVGAASISSADISTSASAVQAAAPPAAVASSKANNQTFASPVAALDELLQLITQVKASLQSPEPTRGDSQYPHPICNGQQRYLYRGRQHGQRNRCTASRQHQHRTTHGPD